VDPAHRLSGIEGLRSIVGRLDGVELPGARLERAVLPARMDRYEPSLLDMLCLTGQARWGRLSAVDMAEPPARVFASRCFSASMRTRGKRSDQPTPSIPIAVAAAVPEDARRVFELLRSGGAAFLRELAKESGLTDAAVAQAIATLTVAGLVTSDGFAGVRAVIRTLKSQPVRFHRTDMTGRWSAVSPAAAGLKREDAIEMQARALLERYGVVFRRVLLREPTRHPGVS